MHLYTYDDPTCGEPILYKMSYEKGDILTTQPCNIVTPHKAEVFGNFTVNIIMKLISGSGCMICSLVLS